MDPLDVVVNGSQHLHSLDKGFVLSNNANEEQSSAFVVETHDSPLVSVAGRNPFPTPLSKLDSIDDGVYVNLYNNLWGTK